MPLLKKKTYSKGTGTPGRATADLRHVGKDAEGGLVAERHVDHAVVGQRGHGRKHGALLTTAHGGSGDEDTSVLAPVRTRLPLAAGLVPESLPLRREVAVARRDTEEVGIVLLQGGRVIEGRDAAVLGRSVHLGQDLIGEGLGDLVEVAGTAGGLDALGLLLGQGLDMTPGGVLYKWLASVRSCGVNVSSESIDPFLPFIEQNRELDLRR